MKIKSLIVSVVGAIAIIGSMVFIFNIDRMDDRNKKQRIDKENLY